jgi:transcription elongation GreA/GreB family factor
MREGGEFCHLSGLRRRIDAQDEAEIGATSVKVMSQNETAEVLDRPISPRGNFVTEAGLAAIEAALTRFEAAHRAATDKGDREAATSAPRDVRYWRARRASAEVVKPAADKSKASFGMSVTLRRDDGREQSFRMVGEDEADPSLGTVSYVSPLGPGRFDPRGRRDR